MRPCFTPIAGRTFFQEPSAHGCGAEGFVRVYDQAGAGGGFQGFAVSAVGEPDVDYDVLVEGASVVDCCFAKIENINRQSLSILCANFRILSCRRRIVTLWTSFVKRLR